jgi:hypothetical protein
MGEHRIARSYRCGEVARACSESTWQCCSVSSKAVVALSVGLHSLCCCCESLAAKPGLHIYHVKDEELDLHHMPSSLTSRAILKYHHGMDNARKLTLDDS